MSAATLGLAFVAGVLSILSPCVLPLVPIVLGTAASAHRWGAAALAAGLSISFVAIGLFVALAGFAVGLDGAVFRNLAAVLMAAIGILLMVPSLQERFAVLASPLGNWLEQRFGGTTGRGLGGQFGIGLLLGAVWSPCVGPTLGAASVLAAQGKNIPQVAATMALFGLGAAAPLLALGALSREAMIAWRGRIKGAGTTGKALLGGMLVAIAVLILSGADKQLEAILVEHSPAWLTRLTTSY